MRSRRSRRFFGGTRAEVDEYGIAGDGRFKPNETRFLNLNLMVPSLVNLGFRQPNRSSLCWFPKSDFPAGTYES
jgi:hypothetical protein